MTRNVVRLPFVDHNARFLTRIRWLSTATVSLQNCGDYLQLRGHNFSSSISVRNLRRKAKGRTGYGRSRDRVDPQHPSLYVYEDPTETAKPERKERIISLLCYPASNSLTLSLSLLQAISSHLYTRTVKKLAKKPRTSLVLCKKTNGIKCLLH